MPIKPHPTDPDKMVYYSRQYTVVQNPVSITIRKITANMPLPAYSKAHNGNS
jgi:hypothetical protein